MEVSKLINEQSPDAYKEEFAIDVLTGLSSKPKRIPPKYFYDDNGSDIFQKITKHEDYYPTRTEFEILNQSKSDLSLLIEDQEIDIIELGAGDGHKSQLIIDGFLDNGKKVNFFPIDISDEAMKQLEDTIKPHENLSIHGVVADYLEGLRFVREKSKNRQLVLFLGSNIGNFDKVQSQRFLRQLWKRLNKNDFALIGFDLKKNIGTLTAAYNDSAGHTKDFNTNLLTRMNKELGANFDIKKFQHLGTYNPIQGAMESYLISLEDQMVYIKELERSFNFKAYEPMHLEYSFKFLKSDVEFLCKETGYTLEKHFTDDKDYFVDSLWKVHKE